MDDIENAHDYPQDQIYLNCLTYLAADAEREGRVAVARILKAAMADIYDWLKYGTDVGPRDANEIIDSLLAAFQFLIKLNNLSSEDQAMAVEMLAALEARRSMN
ncbi:MAG: hypothetical protein WC807_20515 [Hyphomicrobium sp.]|jgi:hypothetical protein